MTETPFGGLCAVTGLQREARLLNGYANLIVIGGGNSTRLADKIERAAAEGIRAIISIGIAGGLKPGLPPGTPIIASSVIASNDAFPTSPSWAEALRGQISGAILGPIAGGDKILDADAKSDLHRRTGALTIDMESHVAARIASTHGLPFAAFRVIADPAERSVPPAATVALRPDGGVSIGRVLASLAAQPTQIGSLVRTAIDARASFRILARCCRLVGPFFGVTGSRELVRDLP